MAVMPCLDPFAAVRAKRRAVPRHAAGKLPCEQPEGRPSARDWPLETIIDAATRLAYGLADREVV